MRSTRTIRWVLLVLSLSVYGGAQDTSGAQPSTAPAPAFGQSAPILNPENPPVSGLDEPGLELKSSGRSFFAPAAQVSQSAETNAGNEFGRGPVTGVTRFLGALDLQKFWAKTDFLAEYLGGGAFYSKDGDVRQLQSLGVEGITRWRTGQGTIRDAFSYLPEGALGGGYGGLPGLGLTNGGISTGEGGVAGLHSVSQGSVGLIPRLSNSAMLDIVQAITPKTALTVAGGFANVHYFDNTLEFINSDQTTAEGGFSHLLNRHDQIGAVYAYQLFRFPQSTGGQMQNHIVNLRWSHTLSGRLSLIIGAGPQYTIIQNNFGNPDEKRWSENVKAQVRYRFVRTSFVLAYEKFVSSGSGFFAGADTQVVRFAVHREMSRNLDLRGDIGYSHNKSLQTFLGIPFGGTSFDHGFAGAILRKHFGRVYDLFVAYRYSGLGLNDSFESSSAQRHTGAFGVEWHPTPKRIE